MTDINVTLRISDDGTVQVIDQTAEKLDQLNQTAQKANDGGMQSLTKGAADMVAGFFTLQQGAQRAAGMIQQVNDAGVAWMRAQMALNTESGGAAAKYLDAMNAATNNLIPNLDLARDASLALATGIVHSSDEMAKLTHTGAVLGLTFMGDAQSGIQAFQQALEHVGQTRPLASLGLDIQAVKDEYTALTKEGVDKAIAWQDALYDVADPLTKKLEPALTSTGTAAEKLNKQIQDIVSHAGENVAIGIEATLTWADPMTEAVISKLTGTNINTHDTSLSGNSISVKTSGPNGVAVGNFPAGTALPNNPVFDPTKGVPADNAYTFTEGYQYNQHLKNNSQDWHQAAADRAVAQSLINTQLADANNLLKEGWDWLQNTNIAMQKQTDLATQQVEIEAKQRDIRLQGINQAFGVNGKETGLATQVEQGVTGDIASARKALEAQDRRKGYSQAQINADLTKFDADAKTAVDNYDIATGKATKTSIAFRDILDGIHNSAASGAISIASEMQAMQVMETIAANGGSLKDYYNALKNLSDPSLRNMGIVGGIDLSFQDLQAQGGLNNTEYTGRYGKQAVSDQVGKQNADKLGKMDNPFAPMEKSSNNVIDNAHKIGTSMGIAMGQVGQAAIAASTPVNALGDVFAKSADKMTQLGNQTANFIKLLAKVNGAVVTTTVSVKTGSGR